MPKTKKKFIDRKKATTFNLVHRSQRDPLIADETAPQRVLVPVNANIPTKKDKEPDLTPEQRKKEQHKYGIYFDDDYNYLQHLKDTKEVTMVIQPKPVHKGKEKQSHNEEKKEITEKLNLPSSVFASEVEEDVGLLNKAASQGLCLNLDPEVVAALDEDFDFDDPENVLEDNFIELAMGDEGPNLVSEKLHMFFNYIDHRLTDHAVPMRKSQFLSIRKSIIFTQESKGRMPCWGSGNDHTKSRVSKYSSMSSSVIRRNEGLTLLDGRFEKMIAEYDGLEVGALDQDEIEGYMPDSHPMLLEAAEHFEESKRRLQLDKDKEIARIQRLQEIEEESEEEMVEMEVKPKAKWDCETIISTYSNLYNHPKLIEEPKRPKKIKISAKTGIPKDTLGIDNKLTLKSLAKFNAMNASDIQQCDNDAETVLTALSALSFRPKEETPEEKKERKRLLKDYRKERRIEKKANKEAFKEEKKRQEKIMMNNRNNVQGNRIL